VHIFVIPFEFIGQIPYTIVANRICITKLEVKENEYQHDPEDCDLFQRIWAIHLMKYLKINNFHET